MRNKYRCGLCGESGHYRQTCPKRGQVKSATISSSRNWAVLYPDRARESRKRNWAKHREHRLVERKLFRDKAYLNNPKETWLSDTFRAARCRAKKLGLPFDKQIPDLELPDVCPVLGIPLNYHAQLGKHSPNSPSLDRIVPERGYVASNLRVISNRANMLKNNASLAEMRCILADREIISSIGSGESQEFPFP